MHDEALLIPMAAIGLPLVLVPTILAMKYHRSKREWEHLERMKAMEMGLPVPGTNAWPSAAAIAIGAGVPLGAFLFTWLARLTAQTADEVFIAPVLVSAPAIFGGIYLANRLLTPARRTDDAALASRGKPALDPDAYDVVGRRG
jgi:hypothetical protein